MAEMGRYCKAYYARDFRALAGWEENLGELRSEVREQGGEDVEVPRTQLLDDDILYLQETYVVTDGIFKDEHVVFDKVTDEWKRLCRSELGFEVPVYEPIEIRPAEEAADEEARGEPEG